MSTHNTQSHSAEPAPIHPESTRRKRPPTPFHHPTPLPDEDEQLPTGEMTGLVALPSQTNIPHPGPTASDSGISVHPSGPAFENGHTIFLNVDDGHAPKSRNSITSGASFHLSSTEDEYSYPDPFVAKVALKTLRSLNTSHRSVDGHGDGNDGKRGSVIGNAEEEDLHGYGTDTSQRKQQRQFDNATVIPATLSASKKKRSQPLHRELSAGKLRPALRGASTPVHDVTDGAGSARRLESVQGYREPEINVLLANDALRHRKPLPPPPPFTQPGFDPGHSRRMSGFGGPEQNQSLLRESGRSAFSIRALRESLPAIGISLPFSRPRPHDEYTGSMGPPQSTQWHISNASQVSSFQSLGQRHAPVGTSHIQSQHTLPISASIPILEGLLPSSGKTPRHTTHDRQKKHPADDLSLYLRLASLPKWDKWIDPDVKTSSRWHDRSNWGTGRARNNSKNHGSSYKYEIITSSPDLQNEPSGRKRTINRLVQSATKQANHVVSQGQEHTSAPPSAPGIDVMSKDEPADTPARYLRSWEARRRFLDAIENFYEKNIPHRSIPPANRWGEQIFAVEAEGFDTAFYHDEATERAEDAGLLGYLTGSVLKTAVSVLHMLRFNALDFSFHVIPASIAARTTTGEQGHHHFERGGQSVHVPTELPDGCGSLALVNNQTPTDRSLVVVIRPPWLVGTSELRAFVEAAPNWRQGSPAFLETREGQANLLQAQVFDDCLSNYCFFWCVTNLKYWVFGHFNPDFTRCAVSPMISRKAREPSVMQILTVWLVRSVDERPRPDVVVTRGTIPPQQPDEQPAPVRRLPDTPQGDPHDSRFDLGPRYRPAPGSFPDSRYTGDVRRDNAFLPHHPDTSSATHGMAPPYAYSSVGVTTYPSWYEMAYHQATPFPPMMTPPFSQRYDTGAGPGYMPIYSPLSSPPMMPPNFHAWPGRTDVEHPDDRRYEGGSGQRRRGRNI